jgi:cysteine synthase A
MWCDKRLAAFYEWTKLVGRTPLVQLEHNLYAKLELYNPTGSIKDRIIQYIIANNISSNSLLPNMTAVEATSGNTGIALAAISATLGIPCTIIMPKNMSKERTQFMTSLGAKIVYARKSDFAHAIDMRNKLLQNKDYWSPCQFENKLNIETHYKTTAPEIARSLWLEGKVFDIFVSGAGTGGTITGIGKFLKEDNPNSRVVLIEPEELPGPHEIQGIGDGNSYLVDYSLVDNEEKVKSKDAISASKAFAKSHGISIGISSGANYLIAKKYAKNNPNKNVVTIFCDRGERYFSSI